MAIANRWLYAVLILGLLLCGSALAGPDFSDPNDTVSGFKGFQHDLSTAISEILTQPDYQNGALLLWAFFAVLLLIWTFSQWALGAARFTDILQALFLVLFTKLFMSQGIYDELTTACWDFANGMGRLVQIGVIGQGDLFYTPLFVTKLTAAMVLPELTDFNMGTLMLKLLVIATLSFSSILLSLLAFIATVWGLWGYTLAKIIGLFFIPTLMYERLSWLFDGWLRFFFGFLVYVIVARVNMAMLVLALISYLGMGVPELSDEFTPIVFDPIENFSQILGLLAFVWVGLFALFSTGKFASAVVAGAGGGGIGGAFSGVARSAAMLVSKGRIK